MLTNHSTLSSLYAVNQAGAFSVRAIHPKNHTIKRTLSYNGYISIKRYSAERHIQFSQFAH